VPALRAQGRQINVWAMSQRIVWQEQGGGASAKSESKIMRNFALNTCAINLKRINSGD
jgi:hypothetical protein